MSTRIVIFMLMFGMISLTERCALGDEHSKVSRPSELQAPCTIVKARTLGSDVDLGVLTLADRNGHTLSFWCLHERSGFENEGKTFVKSQPGNPEEVILLKITKQAFAKIYDPGLNIVLTNPSHYSDERYDKAYTQDEIKSFIQALEYRCATKKETTSSGN